MNRSILGSFVLLVLGSSIASSVHASSGDPAPIVVVGDRANQAEIAATQAKSITLRPTADNPLPRRYASICVKLFGIDPAYGALLAERIRDNMRTLKRPVGGPQCQPNVWIGFTKNSRTEVALLRKQDPAMFASLKAFEIDRIFGGSGAAQVWHATEIRGVDGRPIPIVELNIPGPGGARKIETGYNAQYRGGRLVSAIRSDINGTIVIFDRDRANGKSVQQLADYATFRILAPVQDLAVVPEKSVPSILQLFSEGADPPDGLTEFDWAYLSAYYKLDRGAKVSAIHDAAKQAMLDGTGAKLRERAATGQPAAP